MKKNILKFASLLIIAFAVACGGSSSDSSISDVRVIHGSADAPGVDILVDDLIAISNLLFGENTGYLPIDSGERNFKVNAAGTSTTVIDADVNLEEGQSYSIIASGNLIGISPLVLRDNRESVDGTSLVRVVHNAPSAPNVDVYVTEVGADLATSTPVLENVPFQVFSDYLELTPGEYQVRVTVAGTTDVAIDTGAINLVGGINYSAIASDAAGGGVPFQIILLTDN